MMASPEAFYEYNLKGKNAEQIMSVIRGLKREIGRIKNTMEHPEYAPTMCPTESTQLWCNRLYLERAKEALAEAGYIYIPSQAELKAEAFENNIPYISKVIFSVGGFLRESEITTINIEGEHLSLWVENSGILIPSNLDPEQDDPMTKEEFLEGLAALRIGEWRRNYDARRFGFLIMDGTQWKLEIRFNNGKRPVKIYGDNAYPYNFGEFKEFLGITTIRGRFYD